MNILKILSFCFLFFILTACSNKIEKTPKYIFNNDFKNTNYFNKDNEQSYNSIDFEKSKSLNKDIFKDNKKNHFKEDQNQNYSSIIKKEEFKDKNIVFFDKNKYNSIDFSDTKNNSLKNDKFENNENKEKYLAFEDFYYNKNKDIDFDKSNIYDKKYFYQQNKNDKFDKDTSNFWDNSIDFLSIPFRIAEFLFIPFNKFIDVKYDETIKEKIKPINKN